MSIQPPQGILTIPNATLRVGRLQVDEVEGFDTVLNTFDKNTILEEDSEEYDDDKKWGVKMPNIFVATFEIKGVGSSFNFRNTSMGTATTGYTLEFSGTTLTLKYGAGTVETLTTATIPNLDSVYRKVYLTYEKQHFTVTVDGTLVLNYKDTGTRTFPDGEYVNFFAGTGSLGFKNLKVVAGHFISDGTSNIAYVGGGEVAVGKALAFNRVSNVSQIKVDSNVVTEYTGPHDRPLRKYPEVAMTANDNLSASGYVASRSSGSTTYDAWKCFNGTIGADDWDNWLSDGKYDTSDGDAIESGANEAATTTVSGTAVRGEWVQLKLPKKIRLKDVALAPMMFAGTQYATGRTPTKGVVAGSIDGTNWELVKSFTASGLQSFPQNYYATSIGSFNSDKYYDYFRLIIEEVTGGTNGDRVALGELEFYGHEEGSGSLDTTLKSVYNVPATTGTQLEVYYDGQDYTGVTSMVNDKAGTATNATISNAGGTITFNDEYKAWTFGGTDPGPGVESTRTDTFIATMPSSFSGNQVHSVSTWFRYEQTFGDDAIFSISPSSGEDTNKSIGVRLNEGQDYEIRYYHWSNDLLVNFPHGHTANTWYHMVVTYTGSITDERRGKSVYINGELCPFVDQTTTGELNLDGGDQLQLARRNDGEKEFFGSIANFRLYSKALNADQVKELYDYQKDYFLGSKSQVTLYKGHLGVGVTEPSGQLELAGDERIQEYPPGPMDDYETLIPGHGVFCVSASSQYNSSYAPWKAFRKFWDTDDQSWASFNETVTKETGLPSSTAANFQGILGNWIQLKLPYKIDLHSFKFESRDNVNYAPEELPGAGIVYGSNDEVTWDIVHSFSGVDYGGVSGTLRPVFTVKSNTSYSIFRLLVTKNYLTRSDLRWAGMGAWRLFGTPGPTTLDKGSLTLGRSLDVPRISRYDVDTETPRPEKLVVDFDTTVNSSPTDISGRGNHGTFNGTDMNYSSADKAFVFNGTDDVIYNAGIGNWTDNISHTFSWWFKCESVGADNYGGGLVNIYNTVSTDNNYSAFSFQTGSSGLISFYHFSNDITYNYPFELNRWYHVAGVYSGSSTTQKVYVDGVDLGPGTVAPESDTSSLLLGTNPKLSLGGDFGRSDYYFDGQISNFKLYNVALEPSEVQKLYRLGRTGRSMVISDTAVGIGKAPEAQLDVRGTANFGGAVGIGRNNPACALDIAGEDVMIRGNTPSLNFSEGTGAMDGAFRIRYDGAYQVDNNNFLAIQTGTNFGITPLHCTYGGNVGIGTTNPSAPLDVPGGIASPGFQAQYSLTCAGLVTWTGSHLSWGYRVIAIPVEKSEFGASGFIDMYVPTSGTSITIYSGSSGSTTTTTTADGFPIGDWEALWYVVTPGQGPSTVDSQYVITSYTNSTWKPNSNWLLLAVHNGDTSQQPYLKFIPTNGNYYTWITPTFENSWTNYSANSGPTEYNSAGYYRDGDGIVRLRGLVKGGTTTATIFTLPVGFRPTKQELFVAISNATNVSRVDVLPTGEVYHNGGGNGWFSLDGITFKAIQ